MKRRVTLAHVVIVIVVTLWAGSMVLDAVVTTYDPPESINLALMAILGPLVGMIAVRGDRRGDNDEGGDDE